LAHATPWSGSVAGGFKSRVHPRPQEREPVNGLVAEDEADVTIRDFATPASLGPPRGTAAEVFA
jgi:hypothetical protein